MALKRIKIQKFFPEQHVPGPLSLEGRTFAASIIEKRSSFSLDRRQQQALVWRCEKKVEPQQKSIFSIRRRLSLRRWTRWRMYLSQSSLFKDDDFIYFTVINKDTLACPSAYSFFPDILSFTMLEVGQVFTEYSQDGKELFITMYYKLLRTRQLSDNDMKGFYFVVADLLV